MPRSTLPPAMKDALLAAVVAKLPSAGTPWPAAEREAWFTMMRNAVAVAYPLPEGEVFFGGPAGGSMAAAAAPMVGLGEPFRVGEPRHSAFSTVVMLRRFVIEPDGTAQADGHPIDPTEIPSGSVIEDYRPQPIDDEYNPVMWKTLGSKKQKLPAGVVLRPAREPWRGRGAMNGEAIT